MTLSVLLCIIAYIACNVASMAIAGGRKVTIVGSGNWGSAIARTIATNVATMDEYTEGPIDYKVMHSPKDDIFLL